MKKKKKYLFVKSEVRNSIQSRKKLSEEENSYQEDEGQPEGLLGIPWPHGGFIFLHIYLKTSNGMLVGSTSSLHHEDNSIKHISEMKITPFIFPKNIKMHFPCFI